MKARSQVTMEFLILIGFLAVMSLGFVIAAGIKLQEFTDESDREAVQEFAASIQTEIELASVVKDGYVRILGLPQKIENRINYSMEITSGTLIVRTEDVEVVRGVPEVVGTLKRGKNRITREGEVITLEQLP